MQRGTEAYAASALRGCGKHRQRIGRDGKLGEKMMVNDGVNVEAHLVGMLDLPEDFPCLFVVRFPWRSLHLAVNTESHGGLTGWTLATAAGERKVVTASPAGKKARTSGAMPTAPGVDCTQRAACHTSDWAS